MNITGKTIITFFIVIIVCFGIGLILVPVAKYSPLKTVAVITILHVIVSFLFGLITKDYSWTDRLWSTAPIGFAWIYAYAGAFSPLVTLAAILVTLWGGRLTFNFARRGGYTGGEDYRWPILEKKINNPFLWQLFNFGFIATYQQFLFICFTIPLYTLSQNTYSITLGSIIVTLFVLAFLVLETIADQQQYEFQQAKYNLLERQEVLSADYKRGFRTTGLFAYSRHPNYLGELGFWWSLYVLSALSRGSFFHWTLMGPLLLTLLFIGSTTFTEWITKNKYEEYKKYQKKVWPIFPKLW